MLIPVALSLLAASAAPIVAASPVGEHRVCVPARDAAGTPTGQSICRTARQWERFLRARGYLDSPRPRLGAASFVAGDQLYRPRR